MLNEAVNPLLLPEQRVCGCRDTRALMPPFREDVLCFPLVPSRVRYCYCSLVFIHSSQSRTVAWAHKWIVDICIQNQHTIVATFISDSLRSTKSAVFSTTCLLTLLWIMSSYACCRLVAVVLGKLSFRCFSLSCGANRGFISIICIQQPSLLYIGQSSGLQIQRSGLYCQHYHMFREVVGLERGPLSLLSIIEQKKYQLRSRKARIRPWGSAKVSSWRLLYAKVDTNYSDKRRSFGRYSSLEDLGHGFFYMHKLSCSCTKVWTALNRLAYYFKILARRNIRYSSKCSS
jgi:hypothetical protein